MTFIADPLVEKVLGCAIRVHRELGPGLLESVYLRCLCLEFDANGIPYRREVLVPIMYRAQRLDANHRIDLLVDGCLVVEVKSVEHVLPVHSAQLLTYMRLANARQGLLLNFNAARLKEGLKSLILRSPSWPEAPSTGHLSSS